MVSPKLVLYFSLGIQCISMVDGIAQVSKLQLGGNGLVWSDYDTTSVLVDYGTTPGAIQPVYLTGETSILSSIKNWSAEKAPHGLGYIEGERPRAWRGGSGGEAPGVNGTYLVDGDSMSYNTAGRSGDYYTIDTAVPVPAFRFGFYTPPHGYRTNGTALVDDVIKAYEVSITGHSDPSWLASSGYSRVGRVIGEAQENFEKNVQLPFPRQYVRYIRYRRNPSRGDTEIVRSGSSAQAVEGEGTIGDFELFGAGAPQQVLYVSKIIDLGKLVSFGQIKFHATRLRMVAGERLIDPDALASVRVAVRTGTDEDPNVYYEYTNLGDERVVSRDRYEFGLSIRKGSGDIRQIAKPGLRASIRYDTENWTYWSSSINESEQDRSFGSGSFIQLRVVLESNDFNDFVRLDSLWIEYAPSLARRVVGEVASIDAPQPVSGRAEVEIGQPTVFQCDLKAEFSSSTQSGFDMVRIRMGGPGSFGQLEMGNPLQVVEPVRVVEDGESLLVQLPTKVTGDNNVPLRVTFESHIYLYAQTFAAEVADSESDGFPQQVDAGDAGDAISTNSLNVVTIAGHDTEVIGRLEIQSSIITPNNDGINDHLNLNYTLLRMPQAVAVGLDVYDLSGELRTHVDFGLQHAGQQQETWDGRDEGGVALAPGIYLVDVVVESEAKRFRHIRTIGVAH